MDIAKREVFSELVQPFRDTKEIQDKLVELKKESGATHAEVMRHILRFYFEKNKPKAKKEVAVKKDSFDFKKTLLELGVTDDIANTWLDVRKKHKANNSEIALKRLLKEVEKSGMTLNEVLTICCEKSWRSFEASWVNKSNNQKGNSTLSKWTDTRGLL